MAHTYCLKVFGEDVISLSLVCSNMVIKHSVGNPKSSKNYNELIC